jgi:hypothetical protein
MDQTDHLFKSCTILGRNYKTYDDGLPTTRATGPDPDPDPDPSFFAALFRFHRFICFS